MKNAIKIFSIVCLLLFSACDKENAELDNSSLPGKWKLSETWASSGSGKEDWKPTKSQVVVEFKTDGSLAGNAFSDYVHYVVKESGKVVFTKADKSEQNYSYELKDGKLTMYPDGPIYCIEGCGDRYVKVN